MNNVSSTPLLTAVACSLSKQGVLQVALATNTQTYFSCLNRHTSPQLPPLSTCGTGVTLAVTQVHRAQINVSSSILNVFTALVSCGLHPKIPFSLLCWECILPSHLTDSRANGSRNLALKSPSDVCGTIHIEQELNINRLTSSGWILAKP